MTDTDPIAPDSPLGRALGSGAVPELPADFADRIVARTRDRPVPLPQTRRGGGGVSRWRGARRLGVGLAVTGALATAAAATGLLGDLPSPERVWNAITGQPSEPVSIPRPSLPANTLEVIPELAPQADAPVQIEGPIDTPEELEEAFRRADQIRENRRALRRENVDRRIDQALERRRAQGLPAPTPEEEAELRARLERARQRGEANADQLIEQRREEMRQMIEMGETLPLQDRQRPGVDDPAPRQKIEELRNLPPAERRARIRELREQRRVRQQERLDRETEAQTPANPTVPEGEPE